MNNKVVSRPIFLTIILSALLAINAQAKIISSKPTNITVFAPPPQGTVITSFQLTSPASGVSPFTIGIGFKRGDAQEGLIALDIAGTQVNVMRKWNDGSIKHAIFSGAINLTANTPKTINIIRSASPTGTALNAASIASANPSASVQLGSFGSVNLSSLLATPIRTFISGPEMVEAHYRSRVGTDQTLLVQFYVRYYKGGQTWIRAAVDNGVLDVATANKSYIPKVVVGTKTAFDNGGLSLTHYAHSGWSAEGWIGADPQIIPKHDSNYLKKTLLVPNYWQSNASSMALDGLCQTYKPYNRCGWTDKMGATGYQEQIGLLPLWDALYITTTDPRAYRSVIANAKALHSYQIVWRENSDMNPTKPSTKPNWSAFGDNQGGGPLPSGGNPLDWENAHHGSAGYLAYILTGDYYFVETMQHQSSDCYLYGNVNWGSGTSRVMFGQTRASAWCQRTIGQLAAIAPLDKDIVSKEYQTLMANNASYFNAQRLLPGQNAIGVVYSYDLQNRSYGSIGTVAPWMHNFLAQSYGHLSDIEPLADMSKLNLVRDFLYRFPIGLLGSGATGSYCFTKASNYNVTISSNPSDLEVDAFDSWGDVYTATFPTNTTSCSNTLEGGSGGAVMSASTGYWGNLLPAIAFAVDHGAPGAAASWSRLTGASNWTTFANSGFNDIPIWGIVPRSFTGN